MAYGLESARVLGALQYGRRAEEEADRDGLRMLLAAGIDPGEYARAETGRRAERREQALQAIASQQRLLAGVGAERAAAPARGDARAARSEIRVSDRVHHTVREHRVLARDAARRRARERMYRPWR
jgi:hypothetical protein